MSVKKISWSPKLVLVKDIKPTPNNYKLKTELGKERLMQSVNSFGLAGTVVCNTDLCLIDGNSRLVDAKEKGEKKIWVSVPNRKLTPKEFKEMSAMYDFAKAGEVDIDRIKKDQGTHKDFYTKWNIEVPKTLLDTLGANQKVGLPIKGSTDEIIDEPKKKEDEYLVQLFFNEEEEKEFRKLEDKLRVKFKSINTTQTVFKALKLAAKTK